MVRRWLRGRVNPRLEAFSWFMAILSVGTATGLLLSLAVLRFLSSSLLAAMGEACGGIFEAGHGFLAASRWNYLLAVVAAVFLISQFAFLLGGGARLIRVSRRFGRLRTGNGATCPAIARITGRSWSGKIFFIDDESLQAQTVGVFRSRITVNRGLVEALTSDELNAVIAHEEAHRAGRHNLMIAVARVICLTLFYLPGSRMAYREICRALERRADEKAAGISGDPLHIASALVKIVNMPSRTEGPVMVSSMSGNDSAEVTGRLERLVHGGQPARGLRLLPALLGILALTTLVTFTSSAYAVTRNDQRDAFVCFTEHTQEEPSTGVCELDHPSH